jgi:pilus assembly protein Flp/PilA
MKRIIERIKNLVRDEEGASAVEYGIMLAAVAAVVIVVALAIGGKTQNAFNNVSNAMSTAPFTS